MKKYILIAALSALFLSAPARAQTGGGEQYAYDPLHTQVLFTVNHMGFTESLGRFNKFTGGFVLNEQNPELSTAAIIIDANSLDMADATWDDHVKTKFLEAAKYPSITFTSTSVKRTGATTAQMTGDLTLHGVTRPVTLNVTLNKVGMHPMMQDQKHAGFSIVGSIKRSDFGMKEFIPMVGDDVSIHIEVDGFRANGAVNK